MTTEIVLKIDMKTVYYALKILVLGHIHFEPGSRSNVIMNVNNECNFR